MILQWKILRSHTAKWHNYRSGQSLKAIVQVEVEAISDAWPFQWRQVDTWLRKYIYIYTLPANCIALVSGPQRGPYRLIKVRMLTLNSEAWKNLFEIKRHWFWPWQLIISTTNQIWHNFASLLPGIFLGGKIYCYANFYCYSYFSIV